MFLFLSIEIAIPNIDENTIKGRILLFENSIEKSDTVNNFGNSLIKDTLFISVTLRLIDEVNGFVIFKHINMNIADIKLVLMKTINTYFNILPNFFKLDILAIEDDTVVNIKGTAKVNIKFKNISPNGFKYVVSKNIPTMVPNNIEPINIIIDLYFFI